MASAYIKDDQGGTFIPASQRPDGTWRKPRRVKDGYVPQEEVPLYESKGKQFTKNQPTYPVGMSPQFVAAHKAKKEAQAAKPPPIPGLVLANDGKKKKKKSKSKAVDVVTEDLGKTTISQSVVENGKPATPKCDKKQATDNTNIISNPSDNLPSQNTDPAKRLKNLKKKLREIETLEQKIKSGELKNLEKEMTDKVLRKKDVLKEIEQLEENQ
ncbi:partner of Y14 and mago isoform X2 [Diprion similis]|uniref:partner of Y14 and mago isoform X2 n=1 Tax=Diprion similis TaxID=362088 RepID=UPI001EF8BA57|nr:partner of Y14 and mago isoform X2 [Diprion similis]